MERLVAGRFTGAMNTLRLTVLLAATVTTGWMVGLYWSFSIAVMPGLARADDRTFVTGMQGINRAILNGWFALGFGGTWSCSRSASPCTFRTTSTRRCPG